MLDEFNGESVLKLSRNAPCGDYGGILASGRAKREKDGQLAIERTGPFTPPIFFPGPISAFIVVDSLLRRDLEAKEFLGLSFAPVIKKRIVDFQWEHWDLDARDPQVFPLNGDPSHYLDLSPHSVSSATKMSELWELRLADGANIIAEHTYPTSYVYAEGSWNGSDVFTVPDHYGFYCSVSFGIWLRERAGRWISLERIAHR